MGIPVVGLAAHAPGSGKSTVAEILATRALESAIVLPFAHPMKSIGMQLMQMVGLSEERAHWHCFTEEGKSAAIPELGVTGRHFLQTLGTEWGRQCIDPDIWIKAWRHKVAEYLSLGSGFGLTCCLVADDCRFPNEADAIKDLGGEVWLIDRPGLTYNGKHASEGGLVGYPFDRIIHNDGSLADLEAVITRIARENLPQPEPAV